MVVRMVQHVAGRPSYAAGEIIDLKDSIAKAWIEDGICVVHREEKPAERAVARN